MIKSLTRQPSNVKKASIQCAVDSAAANITLNIGGKDNTVTAVKVALDIYDKKEEVQELFRIIDAIEQIHIYPFNIKKEDVKALVSNITLLMQLNCLHKEKEQIKRALRDFFQNTIDQMPRHHIEPGFPGYEAYEQELLAINDVLILMNRVLYKTQHIVAGSSLTLQNPREQPCDLRQINMSILPQDLDHFLLSIEDNDACKTKWEHHFQTFDAESLSNYFKAVINMIQLSSYDEERIEFLIYKLNLFANSLSLRSNSFVIQMMFDVVKGARSPLPRRALTIEPSEPIKKLNALKAQMEQLVFVSPSFRASFSAFRQSLSLCLKSHPTLKEMILTELKQYLNSKEAALSKDAPITATNAPRTRLPTVRSLENRALQGSNSEASIQQIQRVQVYINRCIIRLTEALPQDLMPALHALQRDYQDAHPVSRQYQKRVFLDAWTRTINQYPEKTYSECYRLTQETVHERVQGVVSEPSRCGFFSQHRFKGFITALLQAEPDYDPLMSLSPEIK